MTITRSLSGINLKRPYPSSASLVRVPQKKVSAAWSKELIRLPPNASSRMESSEEYLSKVFVRVTRYSLYSIVFPLDIAVTSVVISG